MLEVHSYDNIEYKKIKEYDKKTVDKHKEKMTKKFKSIEKILNTLYNTQDNENVHNNTKTYYLLTSISILLERLDKKTKIDLDTLIVDQITDILSGSCKEGRCVRLYQIMITLFDELVILMKR